MATPSNDFNDAARTQDILLTVARRDDLKMLVELLEEGGLKPDTETLKLAIKSNCTVGAVRELVRYGAKPDRETMLLAIKHRGGFNTLRTLRESQGFSAAQDILPGTIRPEELLDALRRNDIPSFKTLLEADLTQVPSAAMLREVIENRRGVDTLQLMLDRGATPDRDIMSSAVKTGGYGYVRALIETGRAPVDAELLRESVSLGHADVAELLMDKVSPDARLLHDLVARSASDFKMENPLGMAKLLLKHYARPSLETMQAAVAQDWKQMVTLLAPYMPNGKKTLEPRP